MNKKSSNVIIASIAGHDPTSGAGIVADALRIAREAAHPITVITALTAQSTRGVSRVAPVPPREFRAALREILRDMKPKMIKTGLIPTEQHVKIIANETPDNIPFVVDPVIASSGGFLFINERGLRAICKLLFPRAAIITPNLEEADLLTGVCAHESGGVRRAAELLYQMGPRAVLIKGGHSQGRVVTDSLFDGKRMIELRGSRIGSGAHGTGCALSAILAARLGSGDGLIAAVRAARRRIRSDLQSASSPGSGRPLLGL
ncbi:MAG: hydroxymethylpyrimidine/phosphomethylpyrimidine kinase [Planctomycetota bacterium]